jgi:hypothetical protein
MLNYFLIYYKNLHELLAPSPSSIKQTFAQSFGGRRLRFYFGLMGKNTARIALESAGFLCIISNLNVQDQNLFHKCERNIDLFVMFFLFLFEILDIVIRPGQTDKNNL